MNRGVVVQYDPDRGFGFIRCSAFGAEDVFVHASSIPEGVSLSPGQHVKFTAERSSKGPRAIHVEPGRKGFSPAMISGIVLAVVLVAFAFALGRYAKLSPLWAIFGAINAATFLVYGIDKSRAARGARRVPERVLLGLALAGGSLGAVFAMTTFRHKTRKLAFLIPFALIAIVQVAALGLWIQSRK